MKPKPLLIFISGAWHNKWIWEEYFIDSFKKVGYQCLCIDNELNKCPRTIGIDDYVDQAIGIIGNIEPSYVFISHSMGAIVTQRLLQRLSNKIPAIYLAPVPSRGSFMGILRHTIRHPIDTILTLATLSTKQLIRSPDVVKRTFYPRYISQEKLERYFGLMKEEGFKALFFDSLLPYKPLQSKRALVIGATEDKLFTAREIEQTANAMDADSVFFETTHNMMLDPNTHEEIAAYIIEWLSKGCGTVSNDTSKESVFWG